jgi:two-component system KDP operon response regulator KdpE
VLIAGEHLDERRALGSSLRAAGYDVVAATCADEAFRSIAVKRTDVVLTDLELPDLSAIELCARLREWSAVPVIVLSATSEEDTKIETLDAGADDFVVKPYQLGELLARLRAVTRRNAPDAAAQTLHVFGDVEVDLLSREVRRGGRSVHLTPREFGVLAELCRHPNCVVPHRVILEAVWGKAYVRDTQYLHVYVANLRRKLERDPGSPRFLLNQAGVGYRLRSKTASLR